jgi:hypothetical protein
MEVLFNGLPIAFSRTQKRSVLKREIVRWSAQDFVQPPEDFTKQLS